MPEETNPTAPEAEATDTTTEAPQVDVATLQAKYERAQKDLQKYRTRADEVEASKKALEDEALKQKSLEEQIAVLNKRAEDAEQKATAAETARLQAARTASLTGKVADPKAALKLLDESEHVDTDGNVLVDKLLAAYPFLAAAPDRVSAPAASTGAPPTGARPLKPEDFRGQTPAWIAEHLPRLKPPG